MLLILIKEKIGEEYSYIKMGKMDEINQNSQKLDEKIQTSLKEIEYHFEKIARDFVPPIFDYYTCSNIEILNIQNESDGRIFANLLVNVMTEPAKYVKELITDAEKKDTGCLQRIIGDRVFGIFPIETIEEYMNFFVRKNLVSPKTRLAEKAFVLFNFLQNIERNYGVAAEDFNSAVTELYDLIMSKVPNDTRFSIFSIDIQKEKDLLQKFPSELKNKKKLHILNLVKGVFLDKTNQNKIQEHNRKCLFYRQIPCRLKITRQIAYE